jgi:hypothetical protein
MCFALDLRPMQDATRVWVERIATMYRAAIVPEHDGAHLPRVVPRELFPDGDRPQLVERRMRRSVPA